MERLLQHPDASTEVRDSMQETPLMLAACYHNPAAVRLLVEAGANPRVRKCIVFLHCIACTDFSSFHRLLIGEVRTLLRTRANLLQRPKRKITIKSLSCWSKQLRRARSQSRTRLSTRERQTVTIMTTMQLRKRQGEVENLKYATSYRM